MSRRSIIRALGTVVALIAGLAASTSVALAVNLPDPIGPQPGGGTNRLPAVAVPSDGLHILGMQWQLALAVAVFAVAAVLFLATTLERRHVAHHVSV
jgi:xanthine/uracil/vitamin C permease (AzgA family)